MNKKVVAVAIAAAYAALAWVDPIYIPMTLLAPLVVGFAMATKRFDWGTILLTWVLGGAAVLVTDWIVNNEDQLFHVIVTGLMVGLAAAGAGVGRLVARRRETHGALETS